MSTSLAARTKALRERLVNLDRLGANVEEVGLLESLRSDLASLVAEFNREVHQLRSLSNSGIGVLEPESLEAVRKRARTLLDKFKAERKAATLKKGVNWANLLKEIKVASVDVRTSVEKGWKDYRQSIFTGEAPAMVRRRIAFTPTNDDAFKAYEQLYQAFKSEFDRVPADRDAIERVRALAARLTETAAKFDFDVPPDVRRFLEAVQIGGAKLNLLTDGVLNWLEANNAFDNYRIVPRNTDGSQ